MKTKNLFLTAVAILGLITVTMAQTVPSYVPTNGLKGWYPFNGNVNDESGNGNNGTVNGATLTTDRFGISNKAYNFNNGSNLICTTNSFNTPNQISYSVWIKSMGLSGRDVIAFNSGRCIHGGQWDRDLWIESNRVVYYTFTGSQTFSYANANLFDNIWHNIILTMDGNGSKIYIDGILKSTNVQQTTGESYTGYFRIGGLSPNDLNNSLVGSYDDIGIWNRALTQQEITQLYNSSTLPLTLVQFSAALHNNKTALKWQTANEQNVSHINIQRSNNDKDYATIGTLAAKGNGEYSFIDNNLAKNTKLYYRLQIVDKDGKTQYSNVQLVNIKSSAQSFTIAPNPSNGYFKINLSNSMQGKNKITIFDVVGKLVWESTVENSDNINPNIKLSNGTYTIQITNVATGKSESQQLIISK